MKRSMPNRSPVPETISWISRSSPLARKRRIELLHVFSPTLVNEAKFGFNRSTAYTYQHQSHWSALRILSFRHRF